LTNIGLFVTKIVLLGLCLASALAIAPQDRTSAAGAKQGYSFCMYLITITVMPPTTGVDMTTFCQLQPAVQSDVPHDPPSAVLDATQGPGPLLSQLKALGPNYEYQVAIQMQSPYTAFGQTATDSATAPPAEVPKGTPVARSLYSDAKVGSPDAEGWCDFHLAAAKGESQLGSPTVHSATIDSGQERKLKMGGTYVSLLSESCAYQDSVLSDGTSVRMASLPAELVLFAFVAVQG
jgi:hypothetical protein